MLFMFGTAVPQSIFADGNKSITLECYRDDVILDNMKWRIFRVGERTNKGFVLTGDFSGCHVDLEDMSAENIIIAGQTIESYLLEKQIAPLAEGYSDTNGRLVFDKLSKGLYLAVGFPVKRPPFTYEPSPLLLEVRDDAENFTYDAYPKMIRATLAEGARGYMVKKVWLDDSDLFEARPAYVTVDLFRDGELFDTVTLSEANNWQHRWYSLDTEYQWRVAERTVPVNYEMRVEHNTSQFLIKNRHNTISDWGEVTGIPRTTTSVSVTKTTTTMTTVSNVTSVTGGDISQTTFPPSISSATALVSTATSITTAAMKTTTTASKDDTSKEDLPQTGQLWWPVLPLAVGGALLVFIGFLLRSGKDDE